MVCTKISAGAAISCTALPVNGLKSFAYIINKEDISSLTTAVDGSISAINMKAGGTQAYKYQVGDNTLNSLYSQIQSGIINGFSHTLTMIYPQDDQAAIEQIAKMANGNFLAIVNKRGHDGDGTYRVLGQAQGIVSTAVEGDDSNLENSGLPAVTLSTDPNYYEPKPPVHFLSTDYATSTTALEALLVATS